MSAENLLIVASIEENKNNKENIKNVTEFEIENSFYDDNNQQIRFSPPLYIQRYCQVQKILSDDQFKGKLRKVVEFGCSELSFFVHLKRTPSIEEILFIDIDREVLEQNKRKIDALSADFLHMRERPLNVFIYEGDISRKDRRLLNTDAVIAIELIEHLHPETLEKVPEVIFGVIKPQVAIITTPNAEFNVLFPNFSGFRHPDHKFEWTREEFESWCSQVTSRYPEYQVEYSGVGSGPPGSEKLGFCSQIGTFVLQKKVEVTPGDLEEVYNLVREENYPVSIDNRSDEEKIIDEASYYLRSFSLNNEEDEMPLKKLAGIMETTVDALKDVLEARGWEIVDREGNLVVVCKPLSVASENLDWMDVEDDESWEEWKSGPGPGPSLHSKGKMNLDLEDSGYPTSSLPDVTPESELSSIAEDLEALEPREGVRDGFREFQVENGDLANNNRDREGNNMVGAERGWADVENDNF